MAEMETGTEDIFDEEPVKQEDDFFDEEAAADLAAAEAAEAEEAAPEEEGYWEYWMYCAAGGTCRHGNGMIHKYYEEDAARWGAENHCVSSPHHNYTEEEAEQAVLDNPECIRCFFVKHKPEKKEVPRGGKGKGKNKGKGRGSVSSASDARPSAAAGVKRSLSPVMPPSRRALEARPALKKPLEIIAVAEPGAKRRAFVSTVSKLAACVKNAEAAARVCARQQRQGADFIEAEAHRMTLEWENLQILMGSS
jgi:hypothetical protein